MIGQPIKIIVALDFDNQAKALDLARRLDPNQCHVKIGKELFTACGPAIVEQLQRLDFKLFLDLKFHDIPNTVARAVKVAAGLGVWMLNVHASGGRRMLVAARDALEQVNGQRPLLIGVTVLTSMEAEDLAELGLGESPARLVERLASLSQECGLDGVVCSAIEAHSIKQPWPDCLAVTPGIRPASAEQGDQRRIVTPRDALRAGSDYLVIGRPITQHLDPPAALASLAKEVAELS